MRLFICFSVYTRGLPYPAAVRPAERTLLPTEPEYFERGAESRVLSLVSPPFLPALRFSVLTISVTTLSESFGLPHSYSSEKKKSQDYNLLSS
jgi:hypothetical protein